MYISAETFMIAYVIFWLIYAYNAPLDRDKNLRDNPELWKIRQAELNEYLKESVRQKYREENGIS